MKVFMKKTLTFITVLMLSICIGFMGGERIFAKAEIVDYGVTIGDEQVTSDNMSGEGWRFEPKKNEEDCNKLYLNNATIQPGKVSSLYSKESLNIVLTGNNTINVNINDVESSIYVNGTATYTGGGTLKVKCNDKIVAENSAIYGPHIVYAENMIVDENTTLEVVGSKIYGETIIMLDVVGANNIQINKNATLKVSGFDIELNDGRTEVFYPDQFIAILIYDELNVKENGNISVEDIKTMGLMVSAGIISEGLSIFEDYSQCKIDNFETIKTYIQYGIILNGDSNIGNNVNVFSKIKSEKAFIDEEANSPIVAAITMCEIIVGTNSIIMGDANGDDTFTCIGITTDHEINNIGANSVIKGQGDMGVVYVVEEQDMLPSIAYPIIGGASENEFNTLVAKEVMIANVNGYPYAYVTNSDKKATYVQIGPKVTAKFDANGGSVNKSSVTKYNGEKLGTLPTPTRTGYTFTGWYTAKSGGTKVYSTTKLTKSMTLYAQWKKTTYNITLNANGGSVGTSKIVVDYGKTLGTLPTPTRTGYTFTGWYTAATGGTKVYSTTKPTKSMTLYAQWKIKTYTINFNGNGGTVGVEKKWVDHGNAMEFMPTPKRDGYTFTGWYTAASGGSKVYSTTKVTKNMTLYAQWKKNTYTITFDGNGGTVGVTKKWVNAGDAINFMPTPKRDGYTFTGWYTAASGGSKVYSTTKPTKNMALYAQWKKK